MAGTSYAEIVASDACQEMVQGYVDELNARLNRWETIKKFSILDHDLTVESGELTPPEGQAQGRRGQVQAPPRRPLHELTAAPSPGDAVRRPGQSVTRGTKR